MTGRDSPWTVRRAGPDDGAFMADMLVEAVNWSSEWKRKSRNRVLSAPATGRYIAGWPRETDLGVIAETAGERIGAAWLRFFPASEPGYGFVAPGVHGRAPGVRSRRLRPAAQRTARRLATATHTPAAVKGAPERSFGHSLRGHPAFKIGAQNGYVRSGP